MAMDTMVAAICMTTPVLTAMALMSIMVIFGDGDGYHDGRIKKTPIRSIL